MNFLVKVSLIVIFVASAAFAAPGGLLSKFFLGFPDFEYDPLKLIRSKGVKDNLPVSVDWRDEGWVTPVQNEGPVGQSWTFAVTGAVEAQHMNATGDLIKLSELQLVQCVSYPAVPSVETGFEYIQLNGAASEADYPKNGYDCATAGLPISATISYFNELPSGDEEALKYAVATIGPVAAYIDASHASFQLYSGGVYYEPSCSEYYFDHTVLIVGYGVENGDDYWLVKNCWGTGWGEDGYIKMARNRDNNCGIASQTYYPIV